MKVIRIKNCLDCPFIGTVFEEQLYCMKLRQFILNNTIPPNCPLEDDKPPMPTEAVKEILTVATDPNRKWEGMGKKKRRDSHEIH